MQRDGEAWHLSDNDVRTRLCGRLSRHDIKSNRIGAGFNFGNLFSVLDAGAFVPMASI